MTERGPQHAKRIELQPGDYIVRGMLSAVRHLQQDASVTITGRHGDATFSQDDAKDWLDELRRRGGEAVTFNPSIGANIYTDFLQARQKDPRSALACAMIDIPPSTSSLKTLLIVIDALLFKVHSHYLEGNAITARMPGGETFFVSDVDVTKKWNELCNR